MRLTLACLIATAIAVAVPFKDACAQQAPSRYWALGGFTLVEQTQPDGSTVYSVEAPGVQPYRSEFIIAVKYYNAYPGIAGVSEVLMFIECAASICPGTRVMMILDGGRRTYASENLGEGELPIVTNANGSFRLRTYKDGGPIRYVFNGSRMVVSR